MGFTRLDAPSRRSPRSPARASPAGSRSRCGATCGSPPRAPARLPRAPLGRPLSTAARDVGGVSRPDGLAQCLGQAGHGLRRAQHPQHVITSDWRSGPERQLVTAAEQRSNPGAVSRLARSQLVERRADELTTGHDDVDLVDREVPCRLVRHLRTEAANVIQERRNLPAHRQQIAFPQ